MTKHTRCSTHCDQILEATAVQLQVQTRQCMTFTIPSAVLPRLTLGKRNRGSLETFQSVYVYSHITVIPHFDVLSASLKMQTMR